MIEAIERVLEQVSKDNPSLPFAVLLWDGNSRSYGVGKPRFVLSLRTPEALSDILSRGSMGFGEAYMRGEIDVQGDFQALINLRRHASVRGLQLPTKDKAKFAASYLRNRNSVRRSRENVRHHYDLGNDFYRLWLDESMTYSCAYWREGVETLEQAQAAKYEHLCRKLMLQAGDRLVDIGCGWGGMLEYAAKNYGVEGVGYTLSTEQCDYANDRFRAEGLHPRVEVVLKDYREAEGDFDKFVSVGMFEHVGRDFYPTFFEKAADLLKPGGIGVLHTIGTDVEGDVDPWILKYIFPGGYLPTLAMITDPLAKAGLVLTDMENLRSHYARTLDEWAGRFEAQREKVAANLGREFVRMWRLYLNAASSSFKTGVIELFQLTFTMGIRELPPSRAYLYRP